MGFCRKLLAALSLWWQTVQRQEGSTHTKIKARHPHIHQKLVRRSPTQGSGYPQLTPGNMSLCLPNPDDPA